MAAARGKPVPAPDEIPEDEPKPSHTGPSETGISAISLNNLTIPITSRSQSFNSDTSSNLSPSQSSFPPGSAAAPAKPAPNSSNTTFRGRAKTLATLTTSPKNSQNDIMPREMQLPKDNLVSGQPIEAYLYKDALECPICFLYYPPYLNKTRCCDQPICSECFVQIKRPDPHPPEHTDPTALVPHSTEDTDPDELISEPAACPFCVQPEFGITYDPPSFRRGLTYVNHASTHPLANAPSAMSSASSLGSAHSGQLSPSGSGRRRGTSLSATSPTVITTDRVRPDWHQKLAAARAHTARRSAAATALHTAAYLMGNRQESDGRTLGSFGRRGILRRTSGGDSSAGVTPSQLNMLAFMSERYAAANQVRGEDGVPTMTPGPRGSSRRNRADDLEEMMMMEAIRLSLASEEDRRKREEKDAKKDAKKRDKENKKADKIARKAGVYSSDSNLSNSGIGNSSGEAIASQDDLNSPSGKGKAARRAPADYTTQSTSDATSSMTGDPQEHLERARAQILPGEAAVSSPYSTTSYRTAHAKTFSNASSTTSSLEGSYPTSPRTDHPAQRSSIDVPLNPSSVSVPSSGSAQDTIISGTPPGGGAGMEPMFNFRSLAAMVGDDDVSRDFAHDDTASGHQYRVHHRDQSSLDSTTKDKLDDQINVTNAADDRLQARGAQLLAEQGVPALEITPSSRTNSDLEGANSDRKHAAVGIEHAEHDSSPTAS